jgi:hypothetical protein
VGGRRPRQPQDLLLPDPLGLPADRRARPGPVRLGRRRRRDRPPRRPGAGQAGRGAAAVG